MDGLALLKEIKNLHPRTEVIMISAYADQETAVEAMNEGAYDFFPKPFDNRRVEIGYPKTPFPSMRGSPNADPGRNSPSYSRPSP